MTNDVQPHSPTRAARLRDMSKREILYLNYSATYLSLSVDVVEPRGSCATYDFGVFLVTCRAYPLRMRLRLLRQTLTANTNYVSSTLVLISIGVIAVPYFIVATSRSPQGIRQKIMHRKTLALT